MGLSTDAELLLRAPEDVSAFEELVSRHQASLLRYANRRVGPAQADDIVN